MTTPTADKLITPTSHNVQTYKLKIKCRFASGCDQCVGSRCGRWAWSLGRALNNVISGQCVLKA